jgi:hypothetical protein
MARVAAPAVIMLADPIPMAISRERGWKKPGAVATKMLPIMLKKAAPSTVPVM